MTALGVDLEKSNERGELVFVDMAETVEAVVDPAVAAGVAPLRRRGNRSIILGDSVAQASDGAFMGFGGSWFGKLSEISGQRVRRFRNAGIAGQSSTSILARIQTDVIAYAPDVCFVAMVSPNDPGQGVAAATSQANIVSAFAQLFAAGIRPIAVTGPPNDTDATRDRIATMNAWLVATANDLGIPVVDIYTPVADPATGKYLAGMSSDGIHPNAAGQEAIAASVAARLPADLYAQPILTSAAIDASNLLVNGVFVGDANADGLADGWTNVGTTGRSLITRADGIGNWQSLTASATTQYVAQSFTGWAVGDTLSIAGEWINDSASGISVQLQLTGGTPYSQPRALSNRSEIFATGRTFYMEAVVPSGAASAQLRLIPGIGTTRFGRVTARKLN